MKITLEATNLFDELHPISRPFSFLTNMAEVCVDDIRYDAVKGIVDIPMKRRDTVKQNRKGCLGWWRPPYIIGPNEIDSVLTIRQVIDMKADVDDVLAKKFDYCFNILMGLKIEPNSLYLVSIQEANGRPLCQIFIAVEGINIELVDRDNGVGRITT